MPHNTKEKKRNYNRKYYNKLSSELKVEKRKKYKEYSKRNRDYGFELDRRVLRDGENIKKICTKCKKKKKIIEFPLNYSRNDGHHSWCKNCFNFDRIKRRSGKRKELLDLLGGKCVQCGFKDYRALQIDHKNGGGTKELKKVGTGERYFCLVRKNIDKYQLLCANCNAIKRIINKEHPKNIGYRISRV